MYKYTNSDRDRVIVSERENNFKRVTHFDYTYVQKDSLMIFLFQSRFFLLLFYSCLLTVAVVACFVCLKVLIFFYFF